MGRAQLGPFSVRASRPHRLREDGASLLEYALLLALVAVVAIGALVVVGRSARSPARVAANVATAVGLSGHSTRWWCTSAARTPCSLTLDEGETRLIHLFPTGGSPPYTYSLLGAPQSGFLTLDQAENEVLVAPICGDSGTYPGITLLVTDSVGHRGQLVFSVVVHKGTGC
jgi:hypothetical protein